MLCFLFIRLTAKGKLKPVSFKLLLRLFFIHSSVAPSSASTFKQQQFNVPILVHSSWAICGLGLWIVLRIYLSKLPLLLLKTIFTLLTVYAVKLEPLIETNSTADMNSWDCPWCLFPHYETRALIRTTQSDLTRPASFTWILNMMNIQLPVFCLSSFPNVTSVHTLKCTSTDTCMHTYSEGSGCSWLHLRTLFSSALFFFCDGAVKQKRLQGR